MELHNVLSTQDVKVNLFSLNFATAEICVSCHLVADKHDDGLL